MLIRKIMTWVATCLVRPYGAYVCENKHGEFSMSLALQRIAKHRIEINGVIDIGASDGKWSKLAMTILSNASFLAIEPLKEREGNLKNIKSTHINFDYDCCVAGDQNNKKVLLSVSDDLDGSTVDGTCGNLREVAVKSIDLLVKERNMKGPFLLKFDTHGYEMPILNGAQETLKDTSIIIMEVYNFDITEHAVRFPEMCLHLEQLGFRCYDMVDPMLRTYDNSFWQMDLYFCRSEMHIFKYSQYQ